MAFITNRSVFTQGKGSETPSSVRRILQFPGYSLHLPATVCTTTHKDGRPSPSGYSDSVKIGIFQLFCFQACTRTRPRYPTTSVSAAMKISPNSQSMQKLNNGFFHGGWSGDLSTQPTEHEFVTKIRHIFLAPHPRLHSRLITTRPPRGSSRMVISVVA